MLAQEVYWSPDLVGGIRDTTFRGGVGPRGGLRVRFTPRLAWLTEGGWSWLPDQAPWQVWNATTGLRWAFSRSLAIDVRGGLQPDDLQGAAAAFWYF
jgi:hypothetical protein